MNYEVKLLNAVLESGDYIECQNEGVGNVFINYQDVWTFITSHYEQHKKIPAKQEVKSHFPDFEYLTTTEPLRYYIDNARQESMSANTRSLIASTHELLKTGGPKTALNYLLSNANKLVKEATSLKDTDLVGEWRDRAKDLADRVKYGDKETLGIPTNISADFG